MMPPRKGWVEELPHDDFEQMMNVHVGGAVNWCRLVMPAMREAGFGRIINLSSVNAIQPVPHRYTYVTAKKALRGLTEALALDSARAGITVNAIAPGYILTETLRSRAESGILDHDAIAARTPAGRWGTPEEIAHMAVFLADPMSAYITGTTLCVDGGLTIRGDAGEDLDHSPY
jgi:NAD(P)-dependent dehydrogenase (short-subunit alcohol dehydrogenase family)